MFGFCRKQDCENFYQPLDESAKLAVAETNAQIKKECIFWFLIVLLATACPLALLFFKPENELIATWIQRSGSIIVILGLFSEFRVLSVESLAISKSHSFLNINKYFKCKHEWKIRLMSSITFVLIVLGTIIWGYGDILITRFCAPYPTLHS